MSIRATMIALIATIGMVMLGWFMDPGLERSRLSMARDHHSERSTN